MEETTFLRLRCYAFCYNGDVTVHYSYVPGILPVKHNVYQNSNIA
jgi:hypothetical protein